MNKFIESQGISYIVEGEGEPVVILHGWGCNKEMFNFVIDHLKLRYKVYAFDLPGFGKSNEPSRTYNTNDYSETMKEVFSELGIINPIGIGHSFGGRVLIKMSLSYTFNKLVLTGSAGVVNKKPLSYYMKVYSYKFLKRVYSLKPIKALFPKALDKYRKRAGSSDYNQASEQMKKVLSTVVNENLVKDFDKVEVSTLLIWGEKDTATPLKDGRIMEEKFKDAGLVVFDGGTHYAFLEQPKRFLTVLDAFI